jgi:DNA-binding transcriptional LysR family regulator
MATPITFRHLRYFIATAESGKIQVAAERVHMSPSAVADAIRNLEEILGVKLFERHRSGVNLTYDGHRFLDNAQSILRQLNDSIFAFQNETISFEGELILGASVSVLGYFLPIPLSQFELVYPNIQVTVIENTRKELERQLLADEIDIAFMITSNISIKVDVEVHTLFRSERTLWCAEEHRFAGMQKVSLAEIAKENYIMLASDEAEENITQIWRRYGRKPNIRLKTQSVEAVRSFIARAQGVTILSDLLYRPWSLDGTRIVSKPIEEPVPTMNLGVVCRSDKPQSQAKHLFIEYLKQELHEKTRSSDFRNVRF